MIYEHCDSLEEVQAYLDPNEVVFFDLEVSAETYYFERGQLKIDCKVNTMRLYQLTEASCFLLQDLDLTADEVRQFFTPYAVCATNLRSEEDLQSLN